MGDTPIGVLLGADSLPGARSGIGRQTLEVARLLRQAPAISALALLVANAANQRTRSKRWPGR